MKYGIYKEVQDAGGEPWITYVRVWQDEVDSVPVSYFCNQFTGVNEDNLNEHPIENCSVLTGVTYENWRLAARELYPTSITYSGWHQDLVELDGADEGAYELPPAGTILGGVKTGGDVTISNGLITVNDDSHNHIISNVDGLQSALDGKSATSHTHTAEAIVSMANALFGTNYQGGVEYSYGSGSGKNVLTEISNMPQGFHTIYAIAGTTGNPETSESYRYFIHKTSTTIGWFYAFGADGSIYSNYLAGANTFKGWKTIHDAKRKPLWSSARYMTEGHTVTPSKKLSECEHGWMLLWSDYDPDTATINDTDFCTTMIPNRNWAGSTWNGSSYYCDIPRYSAGTATDSESRIIKVLTVYDNKLVGNANNSAAPRNDVVLRAVYEF